MTKNSSILILYWALFFYMYTPNAAISRSFLDEHKSHSRVWLSVSDEQGHPINSTFNQITSAHAEHIYVSFELKGEAISLELSINRQLFSSSYKEGVGNGVFVDADTNNCYYLGKVYLPYNNTNNNNNNNNNNNKNKNNNKNNKNKVLIDNSQAALSTCDGVRGWVWLDGRSLHIEPEEGNLIGWHFILDDARVNAPISKQYQTHAVDLKFDVEHWRRIKEEQERQRMKRRRRRRMIDWPYDRDNHTLIIELFVVNDHAQFVKQGSDREKVIRRTKSVVNIINSLYRPLNIYIALVGLEVWSDHDRMNPASSTNQSLDLFLTYREHFINYAIHNDNAQLISGKVFNSEDGEGVVGRAPIMTMCSWKYSGGIIMDHSDVIGRLAVTMAHELGHNLGMTHDSGLGCPDEVCIMSPYISNEINPTHWSDESREQLRDAIHLHIHYCLHNLPSAIAGGAMCGNGFVDEGEDCDCGLPQDCTSTCCEASTCTFKHGAVCATGACCLLESCQLRPAHHDCRPIRDSCDLPEYCDGANETCPYDVFKHNGVSCSVHGKDSHCYDGECRNGDTQCRLLWGSSGSQSHAACYDNLNVLGKVSGNCGSQFANDMTQKFVPCNQSDVLCGMLHCEHQNEKLMFWKESTTYQLLDNFVKLPDHKRQDCKGVVYDMGVHRDNPGMVPNGAVCGVKKICASQHCRVLDDFIAELNCPDCHGNGICNSIGQCHCDHGYSPPDCLNYGLGGSTHSHSAHHAYSTVGRTIGITIVVLILLIGIIIITIQLLHRRNFILKEFSLSNFKSSDNAKKNYYKQQQLLQKQQQPLPQLPTGFMTSSAASSELPTTALLSKPPPKMPLPQIPPAIPPHNPPPPSTTQFQFPPTSSTTPIQLPPPRRPPKMKLSSTSFSNNQSTHSSKNAVVKSESIDLKKALRDLNDIDFINDNAPANRMQPFRKAPPPPPQAINQDEEDDDVKIHIRPTAAKRQHIGDNNVPTPRAIVVSKTSKDSNELKTTTTTNTIKPTTNTIKPTTNTIKPTTNTIKPTTNTIKPTTNTIKPTTNTIKLTTKPTTNSSTNLNRRSKVLSKPSFKPPPPPKPKL